MQFRGILSSLHRTMNLKHHVPILKQNGSSSPASLKTKAASPSNHKLPANVKAAKKYKAISRLIPASRARARARESRDTGNPRLLSRITRAWRSRWCHVTPPEASCVAAMMDPRSSGTKVRPAIHGARRDEKYEPRVSGLIVDSGIFGLLLKLVLVLRL